MNNRSKALATIGGIAIVATIAICLLCIKDWSGMTPVSFTFLLWAEIVFFGVGIIVECVANRGESIITRSSWYIIGTAYSGIVFLISVFNLGNHSTQNRWFWVVQIILFAVALIALFAFSSVSKGMRNHNNKINETLASIDNTVSRLTLLSDSVPDSDQAALIRKLSEELRYTDATASVDADAKIEQAVSAIELEMEKSSPNISAISSCIVNLNSAIKERKIQIATLKRGKI